MRRFCIIVLIFFALPVFAQTKRALVVGIGEYPKESGWPVIHGDNDLWITVQMLMSVGFEEKNILELSNNYATKDNIIACLDHLVSVCEPNDVVYLHFSGHGQQMTDLDGDEEDGYDESFVPYDAAMDYSEADNGEKHLTDDEIATYLLAIKNNVGNKGRVITVIDACHSGQGTHNIGRYHEDPHSTDAFMDFGETNAQIEFFRGTDRVFEIPTRGLVSFIKENGPIGICIYACDSGEVNFELLAGGKYYGRLTSVIYRILWDNPGLKVGAMEELVRENMSRLNSRFTQHPVFEYGTDVKKDDLVFGE